MTIPDREAREVVSEWCNDVFGSPLASLDNADDLLERLALLTAQPATASEDVVERLASSLAYLYAEIDWEKATSSQQVRYREEAKWLIKSASLLRAPEAAPGWQKIETAPICEDVLVGRWLSPTRWFQIVAQKIPARANAWVPDSGKAMVLVPTHWTPLPPAPSAPSPDTDARNKGVEEAARDLLAEMDYGTIIDRHIPYREALREALKSPPANGDGVK